MVCSRCNTPIREVTKTGVLIDLCPQCKSVWFDRGELERILARAREVERQWEEERVRFEQRPRDYDDHDKRRYGGKGWYRKKRWTEIFDIFD